MAEYFQTVASKPLQFGDSPRVAELISLEVNGGAGGIRTLDTVLPYTHFPGERLRPLGHRSAPAAGRLQTQEKRLEGRPSKRRRVSGQGSRAEVPKALRARTCLFLATIFH